MQTELIKELNKILKAFPQFWNGEVLHRTMVSEAINQKQPELIKALVANEKIRSVYGADIDGIFIFDFDKLCSLLKYKEYWANSFTKYRNKVGLTSEGKYLDYSSDVVLDFPFKDCVLEGGMTKENQGKDEIYYNEIIARDEIDHLLSPKVFTNVIRYTKEGANKKTVNIECGDNLIIKGNNLIALHSLKERYAGKIDLIYIDPPYNTGSDGFKYNDKFNHSTWLTFIKNRIDIAKVLLSDTGSIFVQIDGNEGAYLKVLLDLIFGRDNFRSQITWLRSSSGKTISRNLSEDTDYILWYSKTQNYKFNPVYKPLSEATKKMYSKNDNDGRGNYRLYPLQKTSTPGPETTYNFIDNEGKSWGCPAKGWRMKESKLKALENDGRLYKEGNSLSEKAYWNERTTEGQIANNLWDDIANLQGSNSEKINFIGQKPEKLIKRIIEMTTEPNDTVLDFHLGSGTTAITAHKMGRSYIGIEQMDYINEITVPRLQKVIDGEQSGISKDVDWQGGGSFIYAELMELNAYFVREIQKAQSTEELEKLFSRMKAEAHLNYQVALESVLSAEYEVDGVFRKVSFSELELREQKQLLIEILDKNQLYVNASDMVDSDLNISESDIAFTRCFYGME
ncbi:site-specific DNA-methyltransferase [Citrobacter braakii]|uniref:site-specific DNA-methyltransferase n=1 Tax=Citrobacter braakii TaxID=57706 RepID=UPI001903C0E1|nr:site-specific DNA-methyltransferase [Citrobacter braakii]MBJ8898515.1 site-specific DNA-methyltransferase [Citrobacter braakii]